MRLNIQLAVLLHTITEQSDMIIKEKSYLIYSSIGQAQVVEPAGPHWSQNPHPWALSGPGAIDTLTPIPTAGPSAYLHFCKIKTPQCVFTLTKPIAPGDSPAHNASETGSHPALIKVVEESCSEES